MTATERQIISKVLISVKRAWSTLQRVRALFSNITLKFSHMNIFQYVQAFVFVLFLYGYSVTKIVNQHYDFGTFYFSRDHGILSPELNASIGPLTQSP